MCTFSNHPRRRGRRRLASRPAALLLALLAGGVAAVGCDRSAPAAGQADAAPTAATALDDYARYAAAVGPLADELKRMKLLLTTRDGTDREQFARQLREVRFAKEKAEPKLGDADRQRESWGRVADAMAKLDACEAGLDRLRSIQTRAEQRPAAGTPGAEAWMLQATRDLGDSMVLREKTLPDAMAAAGVAILVAEQSLEARH